jgi:siroheme synthase-like protein
MKEKETNNLFPVFLKLENMNVLIVGGGKVGLEKLQAVLLNAPKTTIRIIGITIINEIRILASELPNIQLEQRVFLAEDVKKADIVIIAVNDPEESKRIRDIAKRQGKLVNAADKPDQCDFYMGSIVQKGNLKIAISTNGKSPTIAKRIKELLNDVLPPELDTLLDHMQEIREKLKGDFETKVKKLNHITRELAAGKDPAE